MLPPFVDLADPSATDLRVYGNGPRDLNLGQLGYTITLETGDLDGDGRDDLLMSAPYAAGPWWIRSYGGEVYVLFSRDTDADGVGDAADNCPNASNSNQVNTDASMSPPGDKLGDACDLDDDNDRVYDLDEPPCGGDPLNPEKRPERLDLPGDDDGDGDVNEPLPAGASTFDCDGDGFRGAAEEGVPLCANARNDDNSDDSLVNDGCPALSAAETVCTGAVDNDGDTIVNDGCAGAGAFQEGEFNARTSDQDPCGLDGWPADLWHVGGSTNDVDIFDLASFMGPVRRLDTSPGGYGYDHRWDVTPGPMVPGSRWINVQDLTAMSAVLAPPMLGKARAFDGPKCPWAP